MGNWQNGVTPINEDNLDALYDLRRGSNVIASNTDLNDLTSAGTYRCDSSTIATTLVNCPVSSGFKMVVDYTVGTNTFRQTIIMNNSNADIWVRNKSANSWADWHQIATTDNSYYLGVGKPITSGTDLNNLTTPGVYSCYTQSVLDTLSNLPTNAAFKLIVENVVSSSSIRQTFIVNGTSPVNYIRHYYNATWREWAKDNIAKPIRDELFFDNNNDSLTINLSKSVYNYSYLMVIGDKGYTYTAIVPIFADNQSAFKGIGGWTGSENVGTYHVQGTFSNSGTTMTFTYSKSIGHNFGGQHSTSTDRIPIRILGIR